MAKIVLCHCFHVMIGTTAMTKQTHPPLPKLDYLHLNKHLFIILKTLSAFFRVTFIFTNPFLNFYNLLTVISNYLFADHLHLLPNWRWNIF